MHYHTFIKPSRFPLPSPAKQDRDASIQRMRELNQRVGAIRAKKVTSQGYLRVFLFADDFYRYCQNTAGGGAQGKISPQIMKFRIPLPSSDIQKEIIKKIGQEQIYLDSARRMAILFEQKIKAKIAEVWGE